MLWLPVLRLVGAAVPGGGMGRVRARSAVVPVVRCRAGARCLVGWFVLAGPWIADFSNLSDAVLAVRAGFGGSVVRVCSAAGCEEC